MLRKWWARLRGRKDPGQETWSFTALPLFYGERDRPKAWSYLNEFMSYERGVAENQVPAFESLPLEHRFMLLHWASAFEFYRHSMGSYLVRVVGMDVWGSALHSVLVRLRASDPSGLQAFDQAAWTAADRFLAQRANVRRQVEIALGHPDQQEGFRAYLRTYSDMYEIDFVPWYLGTVGRAFKTGRFDPSSFGGPETKTSQGSLIEQVIEALKSTPFAVPFSRAYDGALRNAISHNDYEIIGNDPAFAVRRIGDGRTWNLREIHGLVRNSEQLLGGTIACLLYTHHVYLPEQSGDFADCGIIAVAYLLQTDGTPVVWLMQLWCFRDLDPAGKWLDRATAVVTKTAKNRERIQFTPNAFSEGGELSTTAVGAAMRDRGWAKVYRVPGAPAFDLGYPVFVREDGAEYELVGPVDEHLVYFRFE